MNQGDPKQDPFLPVKANPEHVESDDSAQVFSRHEPIQKILSALRGRWPWALGLGFGLAIFFALSGFLAGNASLTYAARGEIIFKAKKDFFIVWDTDKGVTMPDYELQANTFVEMFQSPTIINIAKDDLTLENYPFPEGEDRGEYIRERVEALRVRGREFIYVDYTEQTPQLAMLGATALVRAFKTAVIETKSTDNTNAAKQVDTQINMVEGKIKEINQKLDEFYQEYGSDNLTRRLDRLNTEVDRYQEDLNYFARLLTQRGVDVDRLDREFDQKILQQEMNQGRLNQMQPRREDADVKAREVQGLESLTEEQINIIAEEDRQFQNLLYRRADLQARRERHLATLGRKHLVILGIDKELEEVKRMMDQRITILKAQRHRIFDNPIFTRSVDELKREYLSKKQSIHEKDQVRSKMAGDVSKIEVLKADLERNQELRDRYIERKHQLQVEPGSAHLLQIVSWPELPRTPSDASLKVRKMLTAGGFVFGGSLGFGLILLIGLLNKRLQTVADLKEVCPGVPVLAILPQLLEGSEASDSSLHNHCIHKLRTMLQIGPGLQGRRVYTVSSTTAGDGKTSVAAQLAISFAASGTKTLLMDADLDRGDLSSKLNAASHRRLGQLLVHEGYITPQQLEQALHISNESRRRLGDTLVDLGYLSRENLDWSLIQQSKTTVGILNALMDEPLELCVTEVGIPNLDVLPIGQAGPQNAPQLAPHAIHELLERARLQYDIVLIDTGAATSSLEASHLAVQSDGVLVVASRDGDRDLARDAVEHLQSVGARVVGWIFNRATGIDIEDVQRRIATVGTTPPEPGGPTPGGKPKQSPAPKPQRETSDVVVSTPPATVKEKSES